MSEPQPWPPKCAQMGILCEGIIKVHTQDENGFAIVKEQRCVCMEAVK